jgi:methyl-accepting chemotaxis protein
VTQAVFLAESGNMNAIQVSSTLEMTVGIVAIVVIVVTTVALTLLWRRIRRATSEHSELISRANLTLRATIGPARRRELSRLRLRLLEETNQTRRTIEYAQRNGSASGELSTLFGRIESVAVGLDAQLGTLRREPSAGLVASALPQARIRVDQVAAAARSIRTQALALDGPGSPSDVELRRLVTDIDGEAQALAQWRATYRELTGG